MHAYNALPALLLAAILASALPSAAWARPPGGSPHGGPDLERLVDRLDLPADTLAEVDAVIDTSRAQQRDLRRELKGAHETMRSLLQAEAPDEGAVLAQADEIGRLRTALDKDRLRTLLRVQALLPAAARAELVERMKRRGPGRGGRHGGGRPGAEGGRPADDGPPRGETGDAGDF